MPTDFEPIPYRIRIGVTGHRKVADPDAMEALVRAAIDSEIAKLFDAKSQAEMDRVRRKGVTAISYSALSPLAEGADRVAARAILAYPGARLDVVLPLSMDDYLEDFETEESKLEFHELIGESRRPVELRHRRIRTTATIRTARPSCAKTATRAPGSMLSITATCSLPCGMGSRLAGAGARRRSSPMPASREGR